MCPVARELCFAGLLSAASTVQHIPPDTRVEEDAPVKGGSLHAALGSFRSQSLRIGALEPQGPHESAAAGGLSSPASGSLTSRLLACRPRPTPDMLWYTKKNSDASTTAGADSFATLGDVLKHQTHDFTKMRKRRVLGQGAFGTVLLMEESNPGGVKSIAVKVLNPNALDVNNLRFFLSEAKLLQQLNHPYIVSFEGFGSMNSAESIDPSTPLEGLQTESIFLAQEYMAGGILREVIAKKMSSPRSLVYTWTDVFRWFLGLAQGMAYLHAQSPAIVHRDLKPENILFSSKDLKTADAKIADFGLSKGIKSRAERDKEGSRRVAPFGVSTSNLSGKNLWPKSERSQRLLMKIQTSKFSYTAVDATGNTGSKMYMAPEVYNSLPYNEKADVFAYGVILFETLKGEIRSALFLSGQPWEAEKYATDVAGGYRRPIPDEWPEEVKMLIAQLWAQEPSERPSMQRVVSFLESFIAERIPQEWDDAHVRKGCFGAQ